MKTIDSAKFIAVIQDLTTYARINEYECSCALLKGEEQEAMERAKSASAFRQAIYNVMEEYLKDASEE